MARKAKSFAQMLPWGNLIKSGTVATKDGQILTGYFATPPDNDSRTQEDAEFLADRINEALLVLGSGWATWADVVSFESNSYPPPEASHFPDAFSRAIDDHRRHRFEAEGEHYENERVFCISYLPPLQHISKLQHLFFTDGNKLGRRRTRERIISYFEDKLHEMESKLAGTLGLRRMQSYEVVDEVSGEPHKVDELINYLSFCASGRVQDIILPRNGAFIDQFIASRELTPGEAPATDLDYIAVVSIDGRPDESQANVLAALSTMDFPYRFNQRVIYLDNEAAAKEIGKYRDKWGQQMRGLMQKLMPEQSTDNINEYASDMKTEANTAYSWAKSGFVRYGFYSPSVVVRHPDPVVLRERVERITHVIAACGYPARIETTNTTEAWLGSMPGDIYSNVRRPLTHSKTLADFMPATGVWTGSATAPCPFYPPNSPSLLVAITDGAIPLRVNLHPGPSSNNGHTIIFGPTDAGKSTLTNLIAVQARRYPGMKITTFDYKNGMMTTALACGGTHFDLANDTHPDGMFCPHAHLEDNNDIQWAIDYDTALYHLQTGKEPSPELKNAIGDTVRQLASAPKHMRSMKNFVNALQDRDARPVFEFYTHDGSAGVFLDGYRDYDEESVSDFSVFECQDLLDLGPATSMPVMMHRFRRFERSLKGQPSLLFIAEAWQALEHPIWERRLKRWLRTLRGKNCAVILDTQSLADAAGSNILPLLSESCPRKIFLPNNQARNSTNMADNPGSYELYKTFGLNDRQIDLIQTAVPRQDYYFTGPDGCRKASLGLSKFELAILGATGEQDVVAVRKARQKHGDDWLHHFMATKGFDYGSPTLERAYA